MSCLSSRPSRQRWTQGLLAVACVASTVLNCSAGQDRSAAAERPAPAAPATRTSCAALLGDVDPAGPALAADKIRHRRALLVGISEYGKLGSRNNKLNSLRTGCDVELMRRVLMDRFGFLDRDIRTLIEGQATKKEVVKAFREHLIEGAAAGDVVVFYFSGHGQLVPDAEAFGGLRGSLVTANYTDGTGPKGYYDNLRSDEVRELLRELKKKMVGPDGKVDGNITVLFDSCHSGNGTKGELQVKGRPWDTAIDGPIPQPKQGLGTKGDAGTKGAFSDFDRDAVIAEGYVFISACRNYEVAYCPKAGTEASVFTYHLAQRMARATPQTTYKDLFETLSVDITSAQIPQLEGEATKLLLAGAAVPGEQYLVVQSVSGKRATLPVGFVQGVAEGSRYALYRADKSVRDAQNKLVDAKVVDVSTTTCVVEPEGPGADLVNAAELQAARAVELERGFGANPLFVLFEGVARPEAELKPFAILTSVDEQGRPVTRANYHVRVRPAGEIDPASGKELFLDSITGNEVLDTGGNDPATGKHVFLDRANGSKIQPKGKVEPKLRNELIWVQDSSGEVLDEFPADDRAPATIVETLFNEWRRRYLAEYLKRSDDPNQTINVKLVVNAVTVKKDPKKGGLQVKEVRKDVDQHGTLRLRDGDYIQLAVQNRSNNVPVFVTVLRIGRDGVFPIFPVKGAPNQNLAANQIQPVKDPFPLPYVVRMTKPYGTDLYKVIATTEPADFSGLLFQRRLPPGIAPRGGEMGAKGEAMEKIPPRARALARLLDEVKDGRKGGETVVVGTEWATDEKYVEVLAPSGK